MARKSINSALLRKRFIIPTELKISDIKSMLCENFHCEESSVRSLQRSFHDTFDWRLYCAGAVIEKEFAAGYSSMNWRELKSGDVLDSVPINQDIRYAWDMPQGKLRERVAPVIEMRALLPLVNTHGKVHGLNVLNKDDKKVVHLVIEDMQLSVSDKSAQNKLPITLSVEPVKGYSESFQKVLNFVEQQFSFEPDLQDSTHRIFETAGLKPGDYSSRLNFKLDPDMRSDAAARVILQRLFETMRANERGLKADWDSEFLHDYRVAIRRTRSLLGQIKGVMPLQKRIKFGREFSWLGEITAACRDMDVYLLDFSAFKSSLPLPLREDINPFRDYLDKHQKIEHDLLLRHLQSARYGRLINDWHAYLQTPLPVHSSLPNAMRPVYDLASERIWHMFRRVIREGEAIQASSPPEDLHELRKSCKKLRYLMEFFLSLYPQNKIRQLINGLKSLQDQLGEYQDFHIQLASLATIRSQMIAEAVATERMLVAFDLILLNIDQRQENVRNMFTGRFAVFSDTKNRNKFEELFNKKPLLSKSIT